MSDPTQVKSPEAPEAQAKGRRRDRGRKSDSSAASASASAASALQSTNRREIPLTSFDFTDGAYKLTIRARRLSFAVLSLTALLLAFVVYQLVAVRSEVTVAQSDLDALQQRETQVVQSLGSSVGGVDPRLLIERSSTLEESLSMAAQYQADFRAILGEIYKVQVPGVTVTDVRIGAGAMSLDRGETLNPKDGIPIRIVASSTDLLSTVTWADQMRRLPMFATLLPEQSGSASVLTGYIVPSAPASVLLERLTDLGVQYEVPPDAPAKDQDSGADSSDSAEGSTDEGSGDAVDEASADGSEQNADGQDQQ